MTSGSRVSNSSEIRAELERILGSESFAHSRRHRAFLSYIVEETLAGRGDRIKGYTIGVEVFGKDPDFDAQADPAVRVDAGRLRKRLTDYYFSEGADNPVQILLKRGSYEPQFRYAGNGANQTAAVPVKRRGPLAWLAVASVIVLVASGIGATFRMIGTAPAEDRQNPPIDLLVLDVIVDDGELSDLAEAVRADVLAELNRHPSPWLPISVFDERSIATNDDLEARIKPDYRLRLRVSQSGLDMARTTVSLVETDTGQDVWSDYFESTASSALQLSEPLRIAMSIVSALRDPFGKLADYELEALRLRADESASPHDCVLMFLHALDRLSRDTRSTARYCLEEHQRNGSLHATGFAALSLLYHLDYQDGFDVLTGEMPVSGRSLEAAERALALDDDDVFTRLALAAAYLETDRVADARDSIERAMVPGLPPTLFGIASVLLIGTGDMAQGSNFARASREFATRASPYFFLGPLLSLLEHEDYLRARDMAEGLDAPEFTLFQALSLALAIETNETDRIALHLKRIRELHPNFDDYGRELIGRWDLPDATETWLIGHLEGAGIMPAAM